MELEAALEQSQFQIQQLYEAAKEEDEKYQVEIQTLMDLNKQANSTKEELESKLTEVREKLKPLMSKKAQAAFGLNTKRSASSRLDSGSKADAYRKTDSGSRVRENNRGRNGSLNVSRNCANDYTTVSRSSSYNQLQFTKEIEEIYREFENGDVTEMN